MTQPLTDDEVKLLAECPQLTRDEAIALHDSGEWKSWDKRALGAFVLFQDKLCVPMTVYHEAVEVLLGRGVYTHEFGLIEVLRAEAMGKLPAPDLMGIFNKVADIRGSR
jgi:hypothetical protein